MADKTAILSVGIDVGTSTTQVVFSKLQMDNAGGYFSVPRVAIVDKEVVYKSEVYMTPLKTDVLIDTDALRDIVAAEFRKAGYRPEASLRVRPSSQAMRRFFISRCSKVLTSASMDGMGSRRSCPSTTVTCAPKAR